MVKKSLFAALLWLALYHLLLPHLSHRFYEVNGLWRANHLRAQRYIYDVPAETKVILGSSMSLSLNDEILGPGFFKLTLPGDSILTELEIIRRAQKRPVVVLIETNGLGKDTNQEFVHDLFTPWLFKLRSWSAIFKEEGRPTNFVVGIVGAVVRKSSQWGLRMFAEKRPMETSVQTSTGHSTQFSTLLAMYQEQYNKPQPEQEIRSRADRIAKYVDMLTQQGCKCIFFEMPIDSSLACLAEPMTVRKAMEMRFPKTRYHWLEFERNRSYQTVDGVHLLPAEANYVTETVLRQTNQIINQTSPAKTTAAHN